MALRANALTTLDACKIQLDIPTSNTAQDALLERYINSASQQIERYCDRSFISESKTEFYDGTRSNELLLRRSPVSAVSLVAVDSERTFGSDTVLVASTYAVVGDVALRRHSGTWGKGSQNIKVTYTAGYSTIPADLEDACILLVEHRYRMRGDRRLGRSSQGKQGESISYIADWPQEVLSILENYRITPMLSDERAILL